MCQKLIKKIKKVVDKPYMRGYNTYCSVEKSTICTSGSVVEYRLAKARVAGSNPVLRSQKRTGQYHRYCPVFFVSASAHVPKVRSRLRFTTVGPILTSTGCHGPCRLGRRLAVSTGDQRPVLCFIT